MPYPKGQIPPLNKGDHISAEHYAAITEAAQDKFNYPHHGVADYTGSTNLRKVVVPRRILVLCPTALPLRSVFQLVDLSNAPVCSRDATVYNADVVDNSSYTKILVTNDTAEIIANTPNWVTIISPDYPIKVLVDSSNSPNVLDPCGVATGSNAVSAGQTGLICLSTINDDDMIDVVAYPNTQVPRIHFVIENFDFDANTATATILDITCKLTPPGLDQYGTVTIHDVTGCLFNEGTPSDYYIGRHGFADYMSPYNDPYNTECRWVVSGLCCPPA